MKTGLTRPLAGVAFAATMAFEAAAQDKPTMGMVVKIGGIPSFNAMEAGIEEKGADLGMDAFMIGPTSADPALQVRAIEDLIVQSVDVIGVVLNDEATLAAIGFKGGLAMESFINMPAEVAYGLAIWRPVAPALRR